MQLSFTSLITLEHLFVKGGLSVKIFKKNIYVYLMSLWNIQTTEHDPIALKSDPETVKNNI